MMMKIEVAVNTSYVVLLYFEVGGDKTIKGKRCLRDPLGKKTERHVVTVKYHSLHYWSFNFYLKTAQKQREVKWYFRVTEGIVKLQLILIKEWKETFLLSLEFKLFLCPEDLGSIQGRVIPKTLKMVLNTSLLNTRQYKVRIKGKVKQSRERSSALPYISVL